MPGLFSSYWFCVSLHLSGSVTEFSCVCVCLSNSLRCWVQSSVCQPECDGVGESSEWTRPGDVSLHWSCTEHVHWGKHLSHTHHHRSVYITHTHTHFFSSIFFSILWFFNISVYAQAKTPVHVISKSYFIVMSYIALVTVFNYSMFQGRSTLTNASEHHLNGQYWLMPTTNFFSYNNLHGLNIHSPVSISQASFHKGCETIIIWPYFWSHHFQSYVGDSAKHVERGSLV